MSTESKKEEPSELSELEVRAGVIVMRIRQLEQELLRLKNERAAKAAETQDREPITGEHNLPESQTRLKWLLDANMLATQEVDIHGNTFEVSDANEAQLRLLAEVIPQFVWITDTNRRVLFCNQRFYDYCGLDRNSEDGFLWQNVLHPEEYSGILQTHDDATKAHANFEMEMRLKAADGTYKWHLVRAVPICDSNHNIWRWFGTSTDIDKQKSLEEELRSSKAQFRLVVEAIPQMVWTARPDGWLDYLNQRCCEYAGVTCEQLEGWNWRDFLHSDDIDRCLEQWARSHKTGEVFEIEYRLRRALDNQYRWHLGQALPFKNPQGQIIKWFGTCTDIDDQKRAAERIRESEERFRTLADAIPQIVWSASPDGEIDFFNHRWFEYTGLTLEQSRSDGWRLLIHPDDLKSYVTEWSKALETGDTYEMEFRLKRAVGLKQGSGNFYRWHLSRAVALRDGNGKIVKWFATWTEIDTQKRKTERADKS